MTTITFRDGIMASDTLTYIHDGACRMPGHTQKIWRLDDGRLLGHAGARRQADALCKWLNKPKGDPPDTGEVSAIVVSGDQSVVVIDGKSEREITAPFYAVGSGAQAALGAMHAGASAEEAVRIAMLVDPYSGGNVDSYKA